MKEIFEIDPCYINSFMLGLKNKENSEIVLLPSWRKSMSKQAYKMGSMIFRFNKKFPNRYETISSVLESLEKHGIPQAHLWLSFANCTPYKSYEPLLRFLKNLPVSHKRWFIEYLFDLIRLNRNRLSYVKLQTFDYYLGALIYSRKSSYDVKNFLFQTNLVTRFVETFSTLHRYWNSLDILQFYFLSFHHHKQSLHENPSFKQCNACKASVEFLRKIITNYFSDDRQSLKFKSFIKELGTFKCRADSEIVMLLFNSLKKRERGLFLEMVSSRKLKFLERYKDQFWIFYNNYGSIHSFPVKFFLNFRKALRKSYVDGALLRHLKDHREFISEEDELAACHYSKLFNNELLFHFAFYFRSGKAQLNVLNHINRKREFWRAMTFCCQWSRHITKPVVKALIDKVPAGCWWDEAFRPELEIILNNIPSPYFYSLYKHTKSKSAKDEILKLPMPKRIFERILNYLKKQSAESASKFERDHVNNVDHKEKESNLLWKIKHPLFDLNAAHTVFNTYPTIDILKALSQKKWGDQEFDHKVKTVLETVQTCYDYIGKYQISEYLKPTLIERLLPLKQISQNIELCNKLAPMESILTEKSLRIGQSDLVGVIRSDHSKYLRRNQGSSLPGVQDGDTVRLFWSLITRGDKDLLSEGERLVGYLPLSKARSSISNKMRIELYKWAQEAGICKNCSILDLTRIDKLVQIKMREFFNSKEIVLDLFDQTAPQSLSNEPYRTDKNMIDIRIGGADILELLYNSKDVGCCYYPGGVRDNRLISWLLSPDTLFLYLFPYSRSDRFIHPIGVVMAYFINNKKTLVIDSVEGKHITLQKFQNWERSVMDAILKAASKFYVDRIIINERVGNQCPKEFVAWCKTNKVGRIKMVACNIPQSLDGIDKEWCLGIGKYDPRHIDVHCRVVTHKKAVSENSDDLVQSQVSSDETINDSSEVRL